MRWRFRGVRSQALRQGRARASFPDREVHVRVHVCRGAASGERGRRGVPSFATQVVSDSRDSTSLMGALSPRAPQNRRAVGRERRRVHRGGSGRRIIGAGQCRQRHRRGVAGLAASVAGCRYCIFRTDFDVRRKSNRAYLPGDQPILESFNGASKLGGRAPGIECGKSGHVFAPPGYTPPGGRNFVLTMRRLACAKGSR